MERLLGVAGTDSIWQRVNISARLYEQPCFRTEWIPGQQEVIVKTVRDTQRGTRAPPTGVETDGSPKTD